MSSNSLYFSGKQMLPVGEQCFYKKEDHALVSVVDVAPPWIGMSMPFRSAHLNPSDACPRKFIIFETTNSGNRLMFHPDLCSIVSRPAPVFSISQNNLIPCTKDTTCEKKITSLLKEDSADIDALLSTEYEGILESEDDAVSTARSGATNECSSDDSVSDHGSTSRRKRLRSGHSSERRGHQKHQKLEEMMKTLKGIVPGAEQMTTANALDEAVHYLKFLQAEVKKMGDGNPKA